jgi:hypothetical protein
MSVWESAHPMKKQILLSLLCLSTLWCGCDKAGIRSGPLSGPVHLIIPGGDGTGLNHTDVRVYDRKTFDAILLEVKKQAEETKRITLDATLKERDRLKEELRFCKMNKEQTERAKESTSKMLSRNLEAYGDQFRSDLLSFNNQIDALNTTIGQDQKALEQIATKESEVEHTLSHQRLVRTLLNALPKPLQEMESDAQGKFQVLVNSADDYVVVTNASRDATGDIGFYRTSIRPTNGETPSALLLSLYNWSADAQ